MFRFSKRKRHPMFHKSQETLADLTFVRFRVNLDQFLAKSDTHARNQSNFVSQIVWKYTITCLTWYFLYLAKMFWKPIVQVQDLSGFEWILINFLPNLPMAIYRKKKKKFLAIFLKKLSSCGQFFWHSNGNFPEGHLISNLHLVIHLKGFNSMTVKQSNS